MKKSINTISPQQKIDLLRQLLVSRIPASTICKKHGLEPGQLAEWRDRLFSTGDTLFNDLTNRERVELNTWTIRSLRNIADEDYIAARSCFKLDLPTQFSWLALQAVEKYLKAILLFNAVEATDINHDLQRALERVEDIHTLQFEISQESRGFIRYLEIWGQNRYLSRQHVVRTEHLPMLDACVWEIRLFCQPLQDIQWRHAPALRDEPKHERIKKLKEWRCRDDKHNFRCIPKGSLEAILDNEAHEAHETLVWKNIRYGDPPHEIQIPNRNRVLAPSHWIRPELFRILSRFIKFEKGTKALIDAVADEKRRARRSK